MNTSTLRDKFEAAKTAASKKRTKAAYKALAKAGQALCNSLYDEKELADWTEWEAVRGVVKEACRAAKRA
jgi:hypothetical protein